MISLSNTIGAKPPPNDNKFVFGRHTALDAARGWAVLCMIYEHFIPTDDHSTFWSIAASQLAYLADGKSAPLFCMLIGVGYSLRTQRVYERITLHKRVWQRALVLSALGFTLGVTIWPTEILLPMGMMTILLWPIRNRLSALFSILLLILMVPLVSANFASYIFHDWLPDGSHLHEKEFGWITLRYFLIDGNYPLIPWFIFPLVGYVLGTIDWTHGNRAKHWFAAWLCATIIFQTYVLWANGQGAYMPAQLKSTWIPTSLPFVLVGTSSSLAIILGLLWWQLVGQRHSRLFNAIAFLGRTSLSHYLLHISLVYVLLRQFYPDEGWSSGVGLLAFAGYTIAAFSVSQWWLNRFARGPAEALFTPFSRKVRKTS